VEQKGQVSPDGQWFWDGTSWLTTLSPDGAWRWDGRIWVAAGVTSGGQLTVSHASGLRGMARWKLAVVGIASLVFIGFVGNAAFAQPPSTPAGHQVAEVLPSAHPSSVSHPASPSAQASPSPSPVAKPAPSPSPTPPLAVATVAPAPVVAPPPPDPYAAATAAGASAVCADGTWSFSKTRSGTCSHHGGVHWWTGNLGPAGPGAH
jgi:hypothetical protein